MNSRQDDVTRLQRRTKAELKEILADLLPDDSDEIPGSLRSDFLLACYEQIDDQQSPFERVTDHRNYTQDRPKKWQLATSLRMLLTERVGRPASDGITSLNKQFLAEVVVAIRTAGEPVPDSTHADASVDPEESIRHDPPPERTPPADSHFEDGVALDSQSEATLEKWVADRVDESAASHFVYVLDCTPPVEGENWRRRLLRRDAARKRQQESRLSDVDRAALAVTAGSRVYYVGRTGDVVGRISRHLGGADAGGAEFLNAFPPRRIVDVDCYPTKEAALGAEARRSEELNRRDGVFSYYS